MRVIYRTLGIGPYLRLTVRRVHTINMSLVGGGVHSIFTIQTVLPSIATGEGLQTCWRQDLGQSTTYGGTEMWGAYAL